MKRRDFLGILGVTLISSQGFSFGQPAAPKAGAKPLRIVVVANTYYEGDGLMTVLSNRWARNQKLDVIWEELAWPRPIADLAADPPVKVDPRPRCRIKAHAQTGSAIAMVELWCLDDLMDRKPNHGSSENKEAAMAAITAYAPSGGVSVAPDGVVAFGTAAFPDDLPYDGCATVGGTIFIRDASADGPGEHSNWSWKGFMGVLVPSKTPASFFRNVLADPTTMTTINAEMIAVPVNPASKPRIVVAADAVAVSSVNIPKDQPYALVDRKTVAAAQQAGASYITSVETTHGVIRAQWPDTPFIYVTAIPNRIGHFPDEASGNYPQEFASTHNAGIALNHVLPHFVDSLGTL